MRNPREARETQDTRETREPRGTREPREDEQPGEMAAMKVPPRNRWQVLLLEYELLDAYWSQLQQRIWTSGLFLAGLSMVGIAFLAVTLKAGEQDTLNTIYLIGGVASVLSVGWWLLLRRIVAEERVSEYRKNEIERELGMRSSLYLAFLRKSRLFDTRRSSSVLAREMAEGDAELEAGLGDFATESPARPRLFRFLGERLVWNLVPLLLVAAWVWLYVMKS